MSPDTGPLSVGASTSAKFPARTPQPLCASFEFSPPKTEAMERTLWETVTRLVPLRPTFFSVTYGAGGSTRQRTHDTVVRLKKETGIDPAAHLTCVGATQGEIDDIARAYWDAGIRHIVALRGDPPAGMGAKYTAHPGGYANAAELVAGLKKIGDFQISVAGYPEKHPELARRQGRPGESQAQGRCRRRSLHHPVLLRSRRLPALPRPRGGGGRQRAGRAGHHAGVELPGGDAGLPACAAPRCRPGWPTCSTGSTTTSRRAA